MFSLQGWGSCRNALWEVEEKVEEEEEMEEGAGAGICPRNGSQAAPDQGSAGAGGGRTSRDILGSPVGLRQPWGWEHPGQGWDPRGGLEVGDAQHRASQRRGRGGETSRLPLGSWWHLPAPAQPRAVGPRSTSSPGRPSGKATGCCRSPWRALSPLSRRWHGSRRVFAGKQWVSTTGPLPPTWLVVRWSRSVRVHASLLEDIEPGKHLGLGHEDENPI